MHLTAGFARRDITPPKGANQFEWGARQHDIGEGVDMPFRVGALFLESGAEKVALFDLDAHLFIEPELSAIRSRLSARFLIDEDKIRVSYTHTHAGTTWGQRALDRHGATNGMEPIPAYTAHVLNQMEGVLGEAIARKRTCRLSVGLGYCALATNRRLQIGDRLVTGPEPEGFSDPSLPVIRLDDESGPYAAVIAYGAHPTVLGHLNRVFSPDFPGHLRRTVEEVTGANCIFLQGCAGDQMTPFGFTDNLALARRYGAALGAAAAHALLMIDARPKARQLKELVRSKATLAVFEAAALPESAAPLRCIEREFLISLRDIGSLEEIEARKLALSQQISAEKDETKSMQLRYEYAKLTFPHLDRQRRGSMPIKVQAMRIGDAALVSFPGEPFAEIGVAIRRHSPFSLTLVSGYTNGWQGYLATPEEFDRGGYEIEIASPFAREAGPQFVAHALSLLRELHAAPSSSAADAC